MTARRWTVLLLVLALDLAYTIHAHLTFHHTANGPAVMSEGQLLGWGTSICLILLVIFIAWQSRRSARERRRARELQQARDIQRLRER
ncbi:MAG: hypothetical protein EPN43_08965 [Jatrophihabitans sp.]|nr:MAG: hypothetical protein EPN43_08965 [Jatrophihabitans sp.]